MSQSEENLDYIKNNTNCYFGMFPYIIFELGLTPYEITVYNYLIRLGGVNKKSWQSRKKIAEKCGISTEKLRQVKLSLAEPRPELNGKSLITVTKRQNDNESMTDLIEVNDIMLENITLIQQIYPKKEYTPPPHGTPPTTTLHPPYHNMVPPLPRGGTKEDIKEVDEVKKNKNIAQTRENSRSEQKNELFFSKNSQRFQGIQNNDLNTWKEIYQAIDVQKQILLAEEWLRSNPTKSNKRLWRKFLTGWFCRANEKAENKKAYQSQNQGSKEYGKLENDPKFHGKKFKSF